MMELSKKYEELKSVKKLYDYMSHHYFSVKQDKEGESWFFYTWKRGFTKNRLIVKKVIEEIDPENLQGNIDEIYDFFKEKKKNQEIYWGDVLLERDKHFWQGDYEGETWSLIHMYDELDDEYEERLKLVNDIEEEIFKIEEEKERKLLEKEKEQYLKLKEKFHKEK